MDNKEIRRLNLRSLLQTFRSDKQFAEYADMDPTHVSQMKNGKNMGDTIARKLEVKFGKQTGWMDVLIVDGDSADYAVSDNSGDYDTSPVSEGWYEKELIIEATRFLFEAIGLEAANKRGSRWTAFTILKLHDLFKDPGSKKLSKETILRLIA